MLSLYVHHALCIFLVISAALAQSQSGQIAQFLDDECTHKSLIYPTVSLDLDTCLVTSGAYGLLPQLVPACNTGSAKLQVYQDQACTRPDFSSLDEDHCVSNDNFPISAVMFICTDESSGPTATTTVTADSVLVPGAKATGANSTSTHDGSSSQTTTDSKGLITSAIRTGSASYSSQTDASSGGGDLDYSGFSQRDQIILGVVLPVGSLAVALLAWLYPKTGSGRGYERYRNSYRMQDYPVVHHMPHWHRG